MGRFSTALLSKVPPSVSVVVSTMGIDSAGTTTCWLSAPGLSATSTRLSAATETVTPVTLAFWNPLISTVTSYVPRGSSGSRYPPSDVVSVVRSTPVSTFSALTFALRMAAPLVSVTVPRIVPRNVCAEAVVKPAAVTISAAQNNNARALQPRSFPMALSLRDLKTDVRRGHESAAGGIKRAIVECLRPNPGNKNSCNSYKRKELESQAYIIDGTYQGGGIAAHRLLYWSIRGLPPDDAGRASCTISETGCLQKPQKAFSLLTRW